MDELSRKDNIVQDEFFGKVVGGALGLMNAPEDYASFYHDVDGQRAVSYTHLDVYKRQVAGIGSNAVNRLGGQGHQLTVLQQGSGFFNALFVRCGQNFSFHFHTDHRSFYL